MNEFRNTLRDYAVMDGYEFKRVKNEPDRMIAHCLGQECIWRIHASITVDSRTFMIKILQRYHTCIKPIKNNNANSI